MTPVLDLLYNATDPRDNLKILPAFKVGGKPAEGTPSQNGSHPCLVNWRAPNDLEMRVVYVMSGVICTVYRIPNSNWSCACMSL